MRNTNDDNHFFLGITTPQTQPFQQTILIKDNIVLIHNALIIGWVKIEYLVWIVREPYNSYVKIRSTERGL